MKSKLIFILSILLLIPIFVFGQDHGGIPSIGGIRVEFFIFGLTLLGVALFHHHTLKVALIGLAVILIFKFIFDSHFDILEHIFGHIPFKEQILNKELRSGEWAIFLNLFGLLLGFAILAKHFEDSGVPDYLPKWLPDDWKGPFFLLVMVFIMSAFLDNIAAAMIGGTIAMIVFKNKVHVGYIAAIVAASNAGGAGSVLGDTTTTMMWIDGVSAIWVIPAFIAAIFAFLFFSFNASFQQDKKQRIVKDPPENLKIDYMKLLIVLIILLFTIATNVIFDLPALGVWIAILIGATFRKTPWHELKHALPGSLFLLSLVMCASMMPVDELPPASWHTAFALGFISSVFDNIPLTKLALDQGGYDWAVLAYAVGFGGSMVWFGSSAGVAISSKFPEARSVVTWLRKGWHVIIAYIIGFFAMLLIVGWNPHDAHKTETNKNSHQQEQIKDDSQHQKTDTLKPIQ